MHDYIIIGGGSSGCTLARRLVDGGCKVLLLEAGPGDSSQLIHIPAGYAKLLSSRYVHRYKTTPQRGLGGRSRFIPQGRTLGGGSSVNAMIYIRGQAEDYDEWARLGCEGWAYRDVLPFFKKAEFNQRYDNDFHGTGGPLKVSNLRHNDVLTDAFVKAAQQEGIPFTPDFNGASQTGVGYNHRRCSAAAAYLKDILKNPLLTVITEAQVSRILIEHGQAIGVEYRCSGETITVKGCKEVIVSAGALQTPKILMLSGIGDKDELKKFNIEVNSHLKGVGKNLQDHIEVAAASQCTGPYGYHGEDRGLKAIKNGAQYFAFGTGPAASNIAEACAFINVDERTERPNIQLHFMPLIVHDVFSKNIVTEAGATVTACVLRPESRGSLTLASTNPNDHPIIDTQDLASGEDLRLAVKGLELCSSILNRPALRQYVSDEYVPGKDMTSEQLKYYISSSAETVYHPSGTCKMGVDDMSVVDPSLMGIRCPKPKSCRCLYHAKSYLWQHKCAKYYDR